MGLDEFHSSFFSVCEDGDVAIAEFDLPQLSDDQNVEQLGRDLFALIEHYERHRIVLDMVRVEYITSSVLGKLIMLHRRLHRIGGSLVLCRVPSEVMSILRTSRLDTYFRLCDERQCAVELARASTAT